MVLTLACSAQKIILSLELNLIRQPHLLNSQHPLVEGNTCSRKVGNSTALSTKNSITDVIHLGIKAELSKHIVRIRLHVDAQELEGVSRGSVHGKTDGGSKLNIGNLGSTPVGGTILVGDISTNHILELDGTACHGNLTRETGGKGPICSIGKEFDDHSSVGGTSEEQFTPLLMFLTRVLSSVFYES